MIIAVDFDGTIVEHRYPKIGEEIPFAVETLKMLVQDRHKLILWSVREGELLEEAVNWCKERGLEFYAVNRDYPEETVENNPHFSRKLKVDLFIDDRNLGGLPDWGTIYRMKTNKYMKKLSLFFTVSLVLAFFSSCGSVKNIAYIQNSDSVNYDRSQYLYDAKIMPKDELTISVNTTNPEVSLPFNLLMQNAYQQGRTLSTTGGTLMPYLVDTEGSINFPIIGRLQVAGLTKRQCERMIQDKIRPYLAESENPIVTVRMSSYSISVLGEVARPGSYMVSREEINVLEALAQAGDLTIYGVRDRVKLIRKNASGRKEIHTLNLNDANIVNSPYFYLQQNDIVYVEPNKVKAQNSSVGSMTTLWFSATSILISLTSLLYNILK